MKNCKACKYCGMEPDDMNFICFHSDAGGWGQYTKHTIKETGHCGPELKKFEQHPLRNTDGSLKTV